MDDLLEDPPIHLGGLTPSERRRYERLRRRPHASLSPGELREVLELHHRKVDEKWESGPDWGPLGSAFVVPPLTPTRGRPSGPTGQPFFDLVTVVMHYPGDLPPTQEQAATALTSRDGVPWFADDAMVRWILRQTRWTWPAFLHRYWTPETERPPSMRGFSHLLGTAVVIDREAREPHRLTASSTSHSRHGRDPRRSPQER